MNTADKDRKLRDRRKAQRTKEQDRRTAIEALRRA